MYAVAIALAGRQPGDVAMPDEAGRLRQAQARLRVVLVEEAQLDGLGDLGEQAEIDAGAVERGAQGIWLTRPDLIGIVRTGFGQVRSPFRGVRRGAEDSRVLLTAACSRSAVVLQIRPVKDL